jgi:hypothetical protein
MSIAAVAGGGTLAAVAAADDDPASRKPEDVLAAAQRDMAKVKSVHVAASETEKGGVTRISGTFTAAGPADFSVAEGKAQARLIVLAKAVYIKGNLTYWKSVVSKKEGTSVARKLAGKWIKQRASEGEDATSGISDLTPKHIASCLGSHQGTLSNKGVKTVAGGTKVIVIQDAGDKPGSAPSQLWVAADGAALPVRMVQTGPRKSGGTKDAACDGESDGKTTKSDITFSQYNKTKPVRAPHGAVSPQQAAGGGSDDGGGTTDL